MKKIIDLLAASKFGVLSTISAENKPQSAVVGFTETEELELIIGTSRKSRKYQNILINPEVSMVIGWDENVTVQYEGLARVLMGEEISVYQKKHFAKQPSSKKHQDDPDEVYILITPTWVRYTDLNQHPWHIEEKDFS